MNTDSYFWKGSSHDVCEDYAWVENNHIVISDGCSSGINTDVGSRILAKLASDEIKELGLNNCLEQNIPTKAKKISDLLNLNIHCLDATLVTALAFSKEGIENVMVSCYGDGVFAHISDNYIDYTHIEHSKNAPNYISYHLSDDSKEKYNSLFGYLHRITHGKIELDGNHSSETFEYTMTGPLIHSYSVKENDKVVVMSDGVTSFLQTTNGAQSPVDLDKVLFKLLSFKNTNGDFVKRRAKRFIKECSDLNWQNFDDVSIAVISL